MALATILKRHYTPGTALGAGAGKTALQADLARYGAWQGALYALLFVCVLGVFALSAYAALRWLQQPQQLATLVGALGISVGGALEALRRVAREWGRTSLLFTLIAHADEARAQMLVEEFLSSLRG